MAAEKLIWIVFLLIFCALVDVTEGYTCSYINAYGHLRYLYCPYSECCGPYYNRYCCRTYNVGGVVGGVIGFIIFVAIVVSIISCCCCACCPYQRYRSNGAIITTRSTDPLIVTSTQNYSSTARPYPGDTMVQPAGAYAAPPAYKA